MRVSCGLLAVAPATGIEPITNPRRGLLYPFNYAGVLFNCDFSLGCTKGVQNRILKV